MDNQQVSQQPEQGRVVDPNANNNNEGGGGGVGSWLKSWWPSGSSAVQQDQGRESAPPPPAPPLSPSLEEECDEPPPPPYNEVVGRRCPRCKCPSVHWNCPKSLSCCEAVGFVLTILLWVNLVLLVVGGLTGLGYIGGEGDHIPHTFSWKILSDFYLSNPSSLSDEECLFRTPSTNHIHHKVPCARDEILGGSWNWFSSPVVTLLIAVLNVTCLTAYFFLYFTKGPRSYPCSCCLLTVISFVLGSIVLAVLVKDYYSVDSTLFRDMKRADSKAVIWEETEWHRGCCGMYSSQERVLNGSDYYPVSCCNRVSHPCKGPPTMDQLWGMSCYSSEVERIQGNEFNTNILLLFKAILEILVMMSLYVINPHGCWAEVIEELGIL